MRDKKEFYSILTEIWDRDVSEYTRLIGDFDFTRYVLKLIQVNPDQLDKPALFIVRVPQIIAGFPPHLFNTPVRRTAIEDYLTRKIADQIESIAHYDEEGISRRRLSIAVPGQKVLPRTSLMITDEYVEARVYVLLPQQNGMISGQSVKDIFFEELPEVVNASLVYSNVDEAELEEFVDLMEDADKARQLLPTLGLVSLVAENSLVARLNNTDYPDYDDVTPVSIDEKLMTEVEVPNSGSIKGMGIPAGITLILGDAYSGRTALMNAIAAGVYNHIPGDGRELIVTVPDAVSVPADAGRCVQKVDVSPFIRELPGTEKPELYTSNEADPCSAQAASVIEALEVGAKVLLFDESSSSPSLLTRDSRLEHVLPNASEKILPLSLQARKIADELGVSIVVAGSSSVAEFIPIADTILRIDNSRVTDVTNDAKSLDIPQLEQSSEPVNVTSIAERNRWIIPSSIDPSMSHLDQVIDTPDMKIMQFGRSTIDLGALTQLADKHQTTTIGLILYYAKLRYMDEGMPIRDVLDMVDRDLSSEGLECLTRDLRGDMARPRRFEIAAALNRLDTLRISHID